MHHKIGVHSRSMFPEFLPAEVSGRPPPPARRAAAPALFSDAENGAVVIARLEDQVTLKRYRRVDEGHVELRPESSKPEHEPIQVDLETQAFEVVGIAVGALIGNGFNGPEHENLGA